MRLVVIPLQNAHYISFATVIQTGSRNETDSGYSDYAYLLEYMMFRNSKNYTTDEREKFCINYGDDNNAYTSFDYTCYTTSCAPEGWKDILTLKADRLMHLTLK